MLHTAVSQHLKNVRAHGQSQSGDSLAPKDLLTGTSPLEPDENAARGTRSLPQRKLKVRKARFRAATLAPGTFTPPTPPTDGNNEGGYVAEATEDATSSPLDAAYSLKRHSAKIIPSDEQSVLQEISNSSMRRKIRTNSRDHLALQGSTRTDRRNSTPTSTSLRQRTSICAASSLGPGNAPSANNSPEWVENNGRRRARSKTGKGIASQRIASESETAKYIEHLETQLAEMETKLSSVGSPTAVSTQAARLKALTAESKMLRQEVADWEENFETRVQDQAEQQESVIRGLKAQVKQLQRTSDTAETQLAASFAAVEDLKEQLDAAERLNHDLGRRVELMSELLATSPTKLAFDDPIAQVRRKSPSRPGSRIIPVSASRDLTSSHMRDTPTRLESPSSPTLSRRPLSEHEVSLPPANKRVLPPYRAHSMDLDAEASVNEGATSPNQHRSTGTLFQSDGEARARPARRMRRFCAGVAGPRPLILPATAQSSLPWTSASAPGTTAATPLVSSRQHGFNRSQSDFAVPREFASDCETAVDTVPPLVLDGNDAGSLEAISLSGPDLSTITTPQHRPPSLRRKAFSVSMSTSPGVTPSPEQLLHGCRGDSGSSHSPTSHLSTIPRQVQSLFQELTQVESKETQNIGSNDTSPTILADEFTSPADVQNNLETTNIDLADWMPEDEPSPPRDTFTLTAITPLTLLSRLTFAAAKSIDQHAPRVKCFLTNTWSVFTLSRPVLEFRCWLVGLLLGGLRRRHARRMLVAPHGAVAGTGALEVFRRAESHCDAAPDAEDDADARDARRARWAAAQKRDWAPTREKQPTPVPDSTAAADDDDDDSAASLASYHTDTDSGAESDVDMDADADAAGAGWSGLCETRERHRPSRHAHRHATPPPVSWLKFSLTLVLAVGLALKDGPGVLFRARGGRRSKGARLLRRRRSQRGAGAREGRAARPGGGAAAAAGGQAPGFGLGGDEGGLDSDELDE